MESLSTYPFFNFQLGDTILGAYLLALIVFAALVGMAYLLRLLVTKYIGRLTQKTNIAFDDVIVGMFNAIGWPFYILAALTIAAPIAPLPGVVVQVLRSTLFLIGAYYAIRVVQEFIDYISHQLLLAREGDERFDPSMIHLVIRVVKGIIWVIAGIAVLQNFGYNVSALLAGLGIGGIAIAFALQNVLGDIFASFSLYFDKPFQPGDFILIGEDMGTIKKIGLKSTRIGTLEGQELVISNKELTEQRVNNYSRMERRRVALRFGVVYHTPMKKLRIITDAAREIIQAEEHTTLDRVHFKELGSTSLDFEAIYYVTVADYTTYMNIQENINFALMERFEKEKIEFAYPTQTLFVHKAK